MLSLSTAVLAFIPVFVVWHAQMYRAALKDVHHIPGMRVLISPFSLLGATIPTTWWNPGLGWRWSWRKTTYMNHSHDIISIVPMLVGGPALSIGTLGAMKQFLEDEIRIAMEKPYYLVTALLLWGDNVIAASGNAWKRHKRIVAPAFTAETNRLVLQETAVTFHEMVDYEGWKDQQEIVIEDFNTTMLKFSLTIICRCGFGMPMPWADEAQGGKMSFPEALTMVSETTILRLITPSFLFRLPIKSLRRIDEAWKTVASLMHELIARKKAEVASSDYDPESHKGDIFTRLVEAHAERGKLGLNEEEVIGNTFALMFAGHETTARTLAGTLGFLAIHQEEQDKAAAEITSTLHDGHQISLDDLSRLKHVAACFHETLRIFPAGVMLTRTVLEDHQIQITRPEERTIPLKNGTLLIIDMIGVHHDPVLFPDPETFRPSRWYDVPEHNVSMFGLGPRACLGRKFAQIEGISFLALFLKEWKVDVILENGETREQYEERVMTKPCNPSLGFGVGPVKLKITKRG